MSISIPNSSHGKPGYGEQLPLAFDVPTVATRRKVAAGRRARRQPPVRTCGQCAGTFRAWGEDRLCGRCLEDGSPRAKPDAPATPGVALGGPEDDGSFHFMMTGEPEPKP